MLLATGMDYRYPEVPGAAERWGRSVFHCPFCHGWEVRDRPLGVLGNAESVPRALLLTAWSDDVTLLTNGPSEVDPADAERLERAGVGVDEREVARLRGPGDDLEAVEFTAGGERPLGGLLVPPRLHQRSDLAAQLGAQAAEPNPLAADGLAVDGMFHTGVPGLFAAGDLVPKAPSVAASIAAGSMAAAALVHELTADV